MKITKKRYDINDRRVHVVNAAFRDAAVCV